MYFEKHFSQYGKLCKKPSILALVSAMLLSGCGSSDDETGNIRFLNLSQNAPDLFLTIDENLDDDDDEDDFEATFSGVGFTEIGPRTAIETDDYFYEVAFADDDDDDDRDDFEIVAEGTIEVRDDEMQLIVVDSDTLAPTVTIYSIEEIDGSELDDDIDDELFNVRILNAHATEASTLFISTDNETFNEAVEVGSVAFRELSENIKLEQDTYIFYITDSNGDLVYTTDDIEFELPTQFVFVIRENTLNTSSPFILDLVSNSTITELEDISAETNFRLYNALRDSDVLSAELEQPFSGDIEFTLSNLDGSSTSAVLAQGDISERTIQENGDFLLNIIDAGTDVNIVNNTLVTLEENDDVTAFVYVTEDIDDFQVNVDDNSDTVVIFVDEIEATINTLLVDNSTSDSVLSHELQLLNFVDPDENEDNDFDFVRYNFITSNDSAEDPTVSVVVPYGESSSVTLLNNTYDVLVVAIVDETEQVLFQDVITLNEESVPLFMVLEGDTDTEIYDVAIFDQ